MRKTLHQTPCALWSRFGKRANGIEGIEQEMGVKLSSQTVELRLDEAALEIGRPQLHGMSGIVAPFHLRGVVARNADACDHRVNEQVPVEALKEKRRDVGRPLACTQRTSNQSDGKI